MKKAEDMLTDMAICHCFYSLSDLWSDLKIVLSSVAVWKSLGLTQMGKRSIKTNNSNKSTCLFRHMLRKRQPQFNRYQEERLVTFLKKRLYVKT